jgi:hypothetical protein
MNDLLSLEQLEKTEAWGGASSALNYVYRPSTIADLKRVLEQAREGGIEVGLRGAGNSYGDAPLNAERILIDCQRMDRILDWDPESGIITVEPGVTIRRLWRYVLGDGWWPSVVPGTMFPTIGGCLGSNVHGKNNWSAGTLGDITLEFEALLPNGELVACRPDHHSDLFYAMIGGLGLLGFFTRIKLQLHRIYSGNLRVRSLTEPNIASMVERMEELKDETEYLVGWVDESNERTVGLAVPKGLSWLLYGDADAPVTGLNSFAPEDRPPVNIVFQSYHIMVAIGMLLIGIALVSLLFFLRGKLFETRWLLWILTFSVLGPQLANQLGWLSAEVGRQPWIVYNLLRTSDGVSPAVSANDVLISLFLFGAIYLLLFILFVYLLNEKIHHGPEDVPVQEGVPA